MKSELQTELDKVPEGLPYWKALNFPIIWRLLKEGTPMSWEIKSR